MVRLAFILTVALLVLGIAGGPAGAHSWETHVDPEFGTRATYPANIFKPLPPERTRPGQAFRSQDGLARLAIATWEAGASETPGEFRDRLLTEEGYETLSYRPRGRSWFVLSGYRGSDIYYEKVIYSCGRRLVNAFALTYPRLQRQIYDPIVERMEDSFSAGHDCD